ncbi:metal ABC transporter substrate-binding protein [Anaerotignum sp. MB30-C6]|uniref:metal ABC transporter substrate-binding protein n=1 Tax=Anaerotignum sp. MB30-C6 TaxID=3070814 RepID=UPI0027DE24FD|nr:metal ABC transporter substrate-binding protein [Anaerotignum sp. MB30-C6]WMI82688.1 metal ABC transporter substrate-binding protein [Anaerotignum sp. MB30-C6]
MKKMISSLLVCIMTIGCLTACSNQSVQTNLESATDNNLSIVCTIFPEYDWVREILGDHMEHAEVTMLADNGVDLHSYQPTTDDIVKISSCDMFVYVGGLSDGWVEDALKEATNKDMVVVNLMDILGDSVEEKEIVEGMEVHEHDHHHEEGAEHEEGTEHQHEEGPIYDEHVWVSLKNAKVVCDHIGAKLGEIDSANAADYTSNANAYVEKLTALDESYQKTVDEATQKTLLFGDRFPFGYLVHDYGISYYAAFFGCSAETEASFETIAFLSKTVDELGLHTVLTIEDAQHTIAETIIQNTKEKNQQILSLNSMQSITSKDVENGVTYFSIMEKNLEVLKSALS